jgi:hypothetical protein
MVDVLLQETNGVQVVFAIAHDAGIRYTKRATTCHLKNLSEKISPKKLRKINAMVSASPRLSQIRREPYESASYPKAGVRSFRWFHSRDGTCFPIFLGFPYRENLI